MADGDVLDVRESLEMASAAEVRGAIRSGRWRGTTHGLAKGHVQANLAIVPEEFALDFMRFCHRNPKPCPLLDVTDTGDPEFRQIAPGSDVRTDLSGYSVYRNGALSAQVGDLRDLWRDDLVAFAMGCSLSFDAVLLANGLDVKHLRAPGGRIAVYTSGLACAPAGPFAGPMVVSLRPVPNDQVARVTEVTSRYPATHGGPVHIGDPAEIGITDVAAVDWGLPPEIGPNETCMFWGCGVTPQAVAMAAKLPFMITHTTGHMFLSDLKLEDITL
ncbi:putative hydro-lyase [Jannaschia seohaensis]|uniref:putative hydro-lyase n=1 Tax=Jannaschia seohaensis TaxID=475081 RepID=UPI001FEC69AA|nr:putative hydro-lyase [Jannaschia seohaensis]